MDQVMIRLFAVVVVLIVGSPECGLAQEPMDSNRLTEAGCQRAEQLMADGGDRHTRSRAMEYLARCGASGGAAIARELLSMRAVTDTVLLNETVREANRTRDARILAASRELAADRSATLESRIAGLRVMVTQVTPTYKTWFHDYLLSTRAAFPTTGPEGEHGAEFPAGWWERADSVLARIMEDPAESEAMQWAASRARLFNSISARPGLDGGAKRQQR